jgi:hypothetical protein
VAQKTIVLISGYARSGKDTLASGIIEAMPEGSSALRFAFADVLKDACDEALWSLGICSRAEGLSFHEEKFKSNNRDILVSVGKLARSIDKDIFVRNLCSRINKPILDPMGIPCEDQATLVVVPDWRYLNEYEYCKAALKGWNIITVRVDTEGVGPANEEEARSVKELDESDEFLFDFSYFFMPDCASIVRGEGIRLAHSLTF